MKSCFGDINVNEVISMYKKLQFHNHQNLGYVELTQPLQKDFDTESTWNHASSVSLSFPPLRCSVEETLDRVL